MTEAHLQRACKDACALLDTLANTPNEPLRGSLLARCDGLVFEWSFKAGVGLGIQMGEGFMIRKRGGGWTAPLFLKSTAARAGLILGAEKVATLLISLSPVLADQLEVGGGRTELGADITIQLGRVLQSEAEKYDLPVDDVDVVAFSVGNGVILDASLKGGKLHTDDARNSECYGAQTSARAVLTGGVAAPAALHPLYQRLAELAAS